MSISFGKLIDIANSYNQFDKNFEDHNKQFREGGILEKHHKIAINSVSLASHIKSGSVVFLSNVSNLAECDYDALGNLACLVVTGGFFLKSECQEFINAAKNLNSDLPVIVVKDTRVLLKHTLDALYTDAPVTEFLSTDARVAKNVNVKGSHVDAFTIIQEDATIGVGSFISSGVSIHKGVKIGEHCFIGENVVIRSGVTIGNRVTVEAGTVVGSAGFGLIMTQNGWSRIKQVGGVEIEDDVEIGANCTIDSGTIKPTKIGRNSKLDNLVHVAHNVVIGKNCAIGAQTGFAGGCVIGDNIITGGQVGFSDHIKIASNSMFAAKSGVSSTIDEPGVYGGIPVIEQSLWRRQVVALKELPRIIKEFRKNNK